MHFEELLAGLEALLRDVAGLSPLYRFRIHREARAFKGFLEVQGIADPGQACPSLWDEWIVRRTRGRARATQRVLLSCLRWLVRYMQLRGLPCSVTGSDLYLPREWKLGRVPVGLAENQLRRLFVVIPRSTPRGLRDHALLTFFLATGARVSEVLAVRVTDISWDPPEVCLQPGKTYRGRVIPLSPAACQALRDYWDRARPPDAGDALWVAARPRRHELTTRRLKSSGTVREILLGYARKAGLRGRVSPHMFRHAFARHLIERGAGYKTVQELLGHAYIGSTMIYTKASLPDLREVADNYADLL